MDIIKFKSAVYVDDYVQFDLYMRPEKKVMKYFYHGLTAVIVLLFLLGIPTHNETAFAILGSILLFIRLYVPYSIKKSLREKYSDVLQKRGVSEFEISEKGVVEKSDEKTTEASWNEIVAVVKDNNLIYILIRNNEFSLFRSVDASEEDYQQMLSWKEISKVD